MSRDLPGAPLRMMPRESRAAVEGHCFQLQAAAILCAERRQRVDGHTLRESIVQVQRQARRIRHHKNSSVAAHCALRWGHEAAAC
eukprot:scaffold20743_cov62-Phaeocystis_antarctica.AAC.6